MRIFNKKEEKIMKGENIIIEKKSKFYSLNSPIAWFFCALEGGLGDFRKFAWTENGTTAVICPNCQAVLYISKVEGFFCSNTPTSITIHKTNIEANETERK